MIVCDLRVPLTQQVFTETLSLCRERRGSTWLCSSPPWRALWHRPHTPHPECLSSAGLGWSPGICHFNQLTGDAAASGLGSNFRVSTQVTHENHQESLKKKKKTSGPSPDQLYQNLWCFLSCVLLLFYKALGKTLIYSQGFRPTELQDVYSIRTVLRGWAPALLCSGSLRMTQGVPHQPTHQHTPPPRATCWDSSQDTPERYLLLLLLSLSHVQLFAIPWTAARQTSLPFTISQSLLKLMSIESVMPSNHLIL